MPTSVEAVIILVFLVSPGVVLFQFARFSIQNIEAKSDIQFLITMITVGAAVHVLAFPWSNRIIGYYLDKELSVHRGETFFWAVLVVFIGPAAIGALSGRVLIKDSIDAVLSRVGLGYIDRLPSAWDYIMEQKAPRYVRIHLKDGGMIGGVFASESFGSTNPKRADLYLQQAWLLDEFGNFVEPLPTSQGVWVSHDVIAYVYLLEGSDTPHEQEQPV